MSGSDWTARAAGVVVGLLAATVAFRSIGWPAPAISAALGFGAYLLARRPTGPR